MSGTPKPGETGKFKSPFGSFRVRPWAVSAASALLVIWGAGYVYNTQIKHAIPSRPGQTAEIEFTRQEMAEHAFLEPDWTFKSPDENFYGEGHYDAVCMEWRGHNNSVQKCIAHPDQAGESPIAPMAAQGAGLLLSTQQPPTWCGRYEDQFTHPGYHQWNECAYEGDWIRYCFAFDDGCEGYRDYNRRYDSWAPFRWTYCLHG